MLKEITWNDHIWPCYPSSDGREERDILTFRRRKCGLEKINKVILVKRLDLWGPQFKAWAAKVVLRLQKCSPWGAAVHFVFAVMEKEHGNSVERELLKPDTCLEKRNHDFQKIGWVSPTQCNKVSRSACLCLVYIHERSNVNPVAVPGR